MKEPYHTLIIEMTLIVLLHLYALMVGGSILIYLFKKLS